MMQAPGRPAPTQVFGRVVESPRHEGPVHLQPAAPPARLISINQDALRAAGLLPPPHQERQIANQYRQIKRPLIDNAIGRGKTALPNGQVLMLASAMPGEGKTFTAINLSFSMAREKDLRVLLIDADVLKPQVSRMFGIAEERGLVDALVDSSVDVESLILSTDIPNLSVLPAGARNTDQATELFASARMSALVRELSRRDPARVIVFDSPPLLLTTESRALSHIVGQIVIVVRADHTPQDVVIDALSHLPEGAPTFMILNQSVVKGESSAYYYGYGTQERSGPGAG
jgi:exopolysaccharide/PEP-CTERM locus tyrosine autokinase